MGETVSFYPWGAAHRSFASPRPLDHPAPAWRAALLMPWPALLILAALLTGCAGPVARPPGPSAENWTLEPGVRRLALSTDMRPAYYRLCQNADSAAAVAVWLMDRTLGHRLEQPSARLEPGACRVIRKGWGERLVLRARPGETAGAAGSLTLLRLDWSALGRRGSGGLGWLALPRPGPGAAVPGTPP